MAGGGRPAGCGDTTTSNVRWRIYASRRPERRPTYHALVATGALKPGFAADDDAALVFRGTELAECVVRADYGAAYRVEAIEGQAVETRMPARDLRASR
jgi:hypothetical protein